MSTECSLAPTSYLLRPLGFLTSRTFPPCGWLEGGYLLRLTPVPGSLSDRLAADIILAMLLRERFRLFQRLISILARNFLIYAGRLCWGLLALAESAPWLAFTRWGSSCLRSLAAGESQFLFVRA